MGVSDLLDSAEDLGWVVHGFDDELDGEVEFEKDTPAGEDFVFTVSRSELDEKRTLHQQWKTYLEERKKKYS